MNPVMFEVVIRHENDEIEQHLGFHDLRKSAEAAVQNYIDYLEPTEFLYAYIDEDCYSIIHPRVGSKEWFAAS